MGAILDTPHTEKTTENGTGNDLRFGVCSMQGWRTEMEDAHCAKVGLKELQDWSFFAVFDGHAGAYVSAHCARNLLNTILQTDSFLKYAIASSSSTSSASNSKSSSSNGDSSIASADGNSIDCPVADEDCDLTNKTLENIKSSMREGFLELDERMKSLPEVESGDISGSTVVCAFISPTYFFFANCGDSRAMLCRNGRAFFSTQDHKPINPVEKERIQRAGGSVMIQRVNGSLAVSRALGDYQYKQVVGRGPCEQLVSPEPEITIHERSDEDEFLIFACDGIWDVMSNDDLCDFVRHQLRIHSNLESVCSSIIDTCLHKGSTDNMSVVLITFKGAPKVCEVAQRKDAELNAMIEKEVNRLLKTNVESQTSIYILLQSLKNIDFENLPPGGGLDAKRSIIDEAQKRFVAENSSPNSATTNNSNVVSAVGATAVTSNNNNATTASAAATTNSSLENDCPNN